MRAIRNSPLISHTLKGCKRLKGSEVKRKLPLSRDDIRLAIKTLQASPDYDDQLFLAILVTGFNGLLRLVELSMPDTKKLRNWRKIVQRSFAEWLLVGYAFFLPTHKADTTFEENEVIIPTNADPTFNPTPVFRRYVASRDQKHPVHPALWVTAAGSIPTWSWFMKRLRQIFSNTRIVGQSMRAGGATDLAEQGIQLLHKRKEGGRPGLHHIHPQEPRTTPSDDRYTVPVYLRIALTRLLPTSFQNCYPIAPTHASCGCQHDLYP